VNTRLYPLFAALVLLVLVPGAASAQSSPTSVPPARISEEVVTMPTYPFSEPNPVPLLSRYARLYPYHSFDGYSTTSEPRQWNVVRLENDFIEVCVLPEAGGKAWGAVVKETGHEFIYRNEVMKFRNIALRGPWTSGGIEFNFGVIGHTPSTATAVDYVIRENPDGSVSCWVGGMDLPSRTHWRVEIRLPADKAYLETNVLWYNPTTGRSSPVLGIARWMRGSPWSSWSASRIRGLRPTAATAPPVILGRSRLDAILENIRFDGEALLSEALMRKRGHVQRV
jgi:hypothetical protein